MNVTYNRCPRVIAYDDAAGLHDEVRFLGTDGLTHTYDHCYRTTFAEPFAAFTGGYPGEADGSYDSSDPRAVADAAVMEAAAESTEYAEAQKIYEVHAINELSTVYGLKMPRRICFDWRDEGELWIRCNNLSNPIMAEAAEATAA